MAIPHFGEERKIIERSGISRDADRSFNGRVIFTFFPNDDIYDQEGKIV